MKTAILFSIALFITAVGYSQNEFINYKAVVKDSNGDIVANQTVGVQFTIFEDVGPAYVENHTTVSTDANGILIISIGSGTATTGTFSAIDWNKYTNLKVEIDIDGGFDNLVDMGTIPFKSVPYALNASNVSGLERITEGGNSGWRLIGANADNHGDIGPDAIDMSVQLDPSSIRGATGTYSLAIGANSEAQGFESIAIGSGAVATGQAAMSIGVATKAESFASMAVGLFNVGGGDPTTFPPSGTSPVFEIGNGTNNASRSNAMTVLQNGDVQVLGEVQRTATGTVNLLPIAYGSVNPDGSIAGGTGNFTVTYTPATKTYEVNVTTAALSFANSTITINPIFGSPIIQGFNFGGTNPGDDFTLTFTSYASGNTVSPAFQFVVYQN